MEDPRPPHHSSKDPVPLAPRTLGASLWTRPMDLKREETSR
jgi:hypothetical protein